MEEYTIRKELPLSGTVLEARLTCIGNDCQILLWGGKPHIGCTVLAVPRESLKKDGAASCTASVLNVTGHKDEDVCRYLAEIVASKRRCVTVCTGGIHVDQITPGQIQEIREAVAEIGKGLSERLNLV